MISSITWINKLFFPLALLYGAIMGIRRRLYIAGIFQSHSLPGKVISIGNLEVGGTGKSPMVMYVAEQLLKQGEQPAILSRGYQSGLAADESAALLNGKVIMPAQKSPHFHADEARMQSARLPTVPVIIGARRWQAAQRYLQQFPRPSTWILDDGFQHLKIRRDQNWLLLDETTAAAQFQLMPVGRLREPPSAIVYADRLIFTRADLSQSPVSLQKKWELKGKPCYRAAFSLGEAYAISPEKKDLEISRQMSCALATAIAKPQILLNSLAQQGWNITAQLLKRDHEKFKEQELLELAEKCEAILTTEKDYYRDKEIFTKISSKVFILPLSVRLDRNLFP